LSQVVPVPWQLISVSSLIFPRASESVKTEDDVWLWVTSRRLCQRRLTPAYARRRSPLLIPLLWVRRSLSFRQPSSNRTKLGTIGCFILVVSRRRQCYAGVYSSFWLNCPLLNVRIISNTACSESLMDNRLPGGLIIGGKGQTKLALYFTLSSSSSRAVTVGNPFSAV
jgi:hypothetical protein